MFSESDYSCLFYEYLITKSLVPYLSFISFIKMIGKMMVILILDMNDIFLSLMRLEVTLKQRKVFYCSSLKLRYTCFVLILRFKKFKITVISEFYNKLKIPNFGKNNLKLN